MSALTPADVIADAHYRFVGGSTDVRRDPGRDILQTLRASGYAVVRVPDIAFKGPHDTNGTMLITAAGKAEAGFPVGGSNVGRAVAQILRQVAAAADEVLA